MSEPKQEQKRGNDPSFRTTQWELVRDANESTDALADLCQRYWSPLYYYIRRLGIQEQSAEDLLQAFFARLLDSHLIEKAREDRGKFRTFLITSLRRFMINEWKHDHAVKRGGRMFGFSIDSAQAQCGGDWASSRDRTPEQQFERQWATQVLERAFVGLAAEYQAAGQQELFESLVPFLIGESTQSYDELAKRLNTTNGALRMAASRMRSQLKAHIRNEIRSTVRSESEIDDEIKALFQALQS